MRNVFQKQFQMARSGFGNFPVMSEVQDDDFQDYLEAKKQSFQATLYELKGGKTGPKYCFLASEANDVIDALKIGYDRIRRIANSNVNYLM